MSKDNLCNICQEFANNKCARCCNVYYCSKEHQRIDWKVHRNFCRPFKICDSRELGRHLVSTKPIRAGDIILQESALIWGPPQNTVAVCLGCGKALSETDSKPCSKCGWPVCRNELCEKAPGHIPECEFTIQRGNKVSITNFGINHPTYQCITTLRCLYAKKFLPKLWKKLDLLQSHCDHRKTTSQYNHEKITIAEFILRFFKLETTFTVDEIMRICGIISVNSHEIPLTDPPHIAIYEIASLYEHNCKANCTKSFTVDGKILITAAENIEKEQNLSISYTDSLWGTPNRRHHLYETKFFWCQCLRCQDPTEFQTYFSAIKCQKFVFSSDSNNCGGYLLPKSFLEPSLSNWDCSECNKSQSSYFVHDILERIGRDLAELNKESIEDCLNFLNNYKNYLHPNHFYFVDVKYCLAQLLGQNSNLTNLNEEHLDLKTEVCRDLIGLIKVLSSADKRSIGTLLFELHAAITENGRRKVANINNSEQELQTALLESKQILTEAINYLKYEPELLPEGKICQQAKKNLKDLNSILDKMNKTFLI